MKHKKLVVKYSFLVKTIFQMKSKLKISSAWFSMKIISLTSSRQKKSGSSCLEFIPAGIGRFIASISKNLNCRRIKKLKIFPKRSEEHTSELQSRFDLVCR